MMAAQDVKSVVRAVIESRLGIRAIEDTETVPTPVSEPVVLAWSHQLFSATQNSTSGSGKGDCIIEPGVICEHCGYCRTRGY